MKYIIISIAIILFLFIGCEIQDQEPYCGNDCRLCNMYGMQYDSYVIIEDCHYTSCINVTEKVIIKTCKRTEDNDNVAGAILIHALIS